MELDSAYSTTLVVYYWDNTVSDSMNGEPLRRPSVPDTRNGAAEADQVEGQVVVRHGRLERGDEETIYLASASGHVIHFKVKEINVGSNLVPAMLSGEVDATLGAYWNYEAIQLRQLGRRGVADLVGRCCALAGRFASCLSELEGVSIPNEVVLNQVLVSFGGADPTREVIARIQSAGTCWCGGTVWQGHTAMRISVSCWATAEAHVDRSVAAMIRIARR